MQNPARCIRLESKQFEPESELGYTWDAQKATNMLLNVPAKIRRGNCKPQPGFAGIRAG